MQVRSVQGDTIDSICYRIYGYTAGVTEQVMKTNQHLITLGPVLPGGTLLTLPDQITADSVQTKTLVNLWD